LPFATFSAFKKLNIRMLAAPKRRVERFRLERERPVQVHVRDAVAFVQHFQRKIPSSFGTGFAVIAE
jgi:hypothetical protein